MPRSKAPSQPWEDSERAILRDAIDRRVPPRFIRIPNRNAAQIQNGLALEKRRGRGQCMICGKVPPREGKKTCADCAQRCSKRRAKNVRAGRCADCGDPIGKGGTLSLCATCRERHRKQRKAYLQGPKPKLKARLLDDDPKPTRASEGILRWTTNPFVNDAIARALPRGLGVVDLFVGSGDLVVRAANLGNPVIAVNDIHSGVAGLFEIVVNGDRDGVLRAVRGLSKESPERLVEIYRGSKPSGIEGVAALLVAAESAHGRNLRDLDVRAVRIPTGLRTRMARMRVALAGADVLNLDFAEAIDLCDGDDVLFLADSPWMGGKGGYEHAFENRSADLSRCLLAARGHSVGTTACNREALACFRRFPHLYYSPTHPFYGKSVVFSTLPLDLAPLDPGTFGIRHAPVKSPRRCL